MCINYIYISCRRHSSREKDKNDDDFWTSSTATKTKTKTMNAILINPIVMASAAAFILGTMMCLALYVVKCTINERDALQQSQFEVKFDAQQSQFDAKFDAHVQEYDALYDKCKHLKQKVNTMAAEMSQMRLDANEQTAEIEKQMKPAVADIPSVVKQDAFWLFVLDVLKVLLLEFDAHQEHPLQLKHRQYRKIFDKGLAELERAGTRAGTPA